MSLGTMLPPPPARLTGDGGGGGSDWVELTRARDDIEAHLLTGRLHQAGVGTRAIKDRRAPGAWLHGGSNPWAPVSVLVLRRDLDAARVVLAEISLEGCAEGLDVEDAGRRTALAWTAIAVALGVVLCLVALTQAAAVASTCHSHWACTTPDQGGST